MRTRARRRWRRSFDIGVSRAPRGAAGRSRARAVGAASSSWAARNLCRNHEIDLLLLAPGPVAWHGRMVSQAKAQAADRPGRGHLLARQVRRDERGACRDNPPAPGARGYRESDEARRGRGRRIQRRSSRTYIDPVVIGRRCMDARSTTGEVRKLRPCRASQRTAGVRVVLDL